jgi:hypothetical protein
VGGQRHAPAALSPGKTQYILSRRLGGPQGRSGLLEVYKVEINVLKNYLFVAKNFIFIGQTNLSALFNTVR